MTTTHTAGRTSPQPSEQYEEQVRKALMEIHVEIHVEIHDCTQPLRDARMPGCPGYPASQDHMLAPILAAWEHLAALTGNQDLAGASREGPEDPIRNSLMRMLDVIRQQENGHEENGPGPDILAAWEHLAHQTGHHLTAIRHGRAQPVIPFSRLHEPYQALGVAAFHAGAATLQYGLILDNPQGGIRRDQAKHERYRSAEQDAHLAHLVLFLIHGELAQHDAMAPEIRKYAREMNLWLTRERSLAAQALGCDPVPQETSNLRDHQLDPELNRPA